MLQAFQTTIDETVHAVERVRRVLQDAKEREAWELFVTNYVAFHYHSARYRVRELTRSAYANPELENATDCTADDT